MSQLTRSLPWVFKFLVVLCFMALEPADGISWLAVPEKHTNAKNGSDFILQWHYEMEKNETFLSSEIYFFGGTKPHPTTMASRHVGENTYYKLQRNGLSFSVFGKNNVTLKVQSTAVGQNITYCCEVEWRSTAGKQNDKHCSKVFLYAVPQIIHHTPQLFCKQGDSIKLQCIATGIPSPRVWWIHDDTHKWIASSSDILLNITGRRSGGRYCCDADNGFGKDTACTTVNVTEYEPVNTKLSVKHMIILDVNMIRIKCEADASPPANRFIMTINDTEYNSSDGLYSIKVQAPRKDKIYHIAVSCIPCNKYGQGPIKKVVFQVYAPPRFITPLPTLYNMTVSGITMKCETKGIPTPNITWMSGDSGDIVSTGIYYNVSYVKCATKTMTFFCHARNVMGNISSPEIRVNVMTKHNCSAADKGLDGTTPTALKSTALKSKIIAAISICACIFVVGLVIVFVAVLFWKRIKAPKVKTMDEIMYQEPTGAVDLECGGLVSLPRITYIEDDRARVEECGVPTSLSHVKTNVQCAEEEPLYERYVSTELWHYRYRMAMIRTAVPCKNHIQVFPQHGFMLR